jgi:hypothetical protein
MKHTALDFAAPLSSGLCCPRLPKSNTEYVRTVRCHPDIPATLPCRFAVQKFLRASVLQYSVLPTKSLPTTGDTESLPGGGVPSPTPSDGNYRRSSVRQTSIIAVSSTTHEEKHAGRSSQYSTNTTTLTYAPDSNKYIRPVDVTHSRLKVVQNLLPTMFGQRIVGALSLAMEATLILFFVAVPCGLSAHDLLCLYCRYIMWYHS